MEETRIIKEKKKQFYKYAVALTDIRAALASCEMIINDYDNLLNKNYDLFISLHTSIIVNYAKPFTDNKPLGRLPKKFSSFQDSTYQEMHKQLIDLRNQFVAHSDYNMRKVHIYPKNTQLMKTGHFASGLGFTVSSIILDKALYEKIFEVGKYLINLLYKDVFQLLDELFDNQFLPNHSFELVI